MHLKWYTELAGGEFRMGAAAEIRQQREEVVGADAEQQVGAFLLTVREMSAKGVIMAAGLKCPPRG